MNEIMNSTMQLTNAFRTDLVTRFIEYMDVKETTLNGYAVCLRRFMGWMQDNGIKTPCREDIKAYKGFLEGQGFTAGTQSRYLRAVKQFFKWTASEGLYPNISDNIKGAKVRNDNTKKSDFSAEDIKKVLQSIDRTTEAGKRNYCMILLSVTGGLRIIEMQRANIQDIQTIKGQKVLYIQGKGRDEKDEYIKIIPEVEEALEDYLNSKADYKKNSPIFTGTSNRAKGCRLSEPSISRIIKEVFKAAGYDCSKLTAHSLRHTSNTLLFKSGADLYKVQQHARHQDPKTTEIYLHAVDREKDTSEQDIFNQIFNPEKQDISKEIFEAAKGLTAEEQAKVLDYIKSLKQEKIKPA